MWWGQPTSTEAGRGANVSPQYKSVPVEFWDPFRLLNNADGGPVRESFFSSSSWLRPTQTRQVFESIS